MSLWNVAQNRNIQVRYKYLKTLRRHSTWVNIPSYFPALVGAAECDSGSRSRDLHTDKEELLNGDIYITEWQMSASSGKCIPRRHTAGMLFCTSPWRRRRMRAREEGRLKRSVSLSFIGSHTHTHWHPFTLFARWNSWQHWRHESLDLPPRLLSVMRPVTSTATTLRLDLLSGIIVVLKFIQV